MIIDLECKVCGGLFTDDIQDSIYEDVALRRAIINWAQCSSCQEREKIEIAKRQHEERKIERMSELQVRYNARMKDSNLEKYRMEYDLHHPSANPELYNFILDNIDHSLWIAGTTGLCKTRIVHCMAAEAIKTRTVMYWPSSDLMNYLSSNATKIDSVMWPLLHVDLLIIDDLGKETVSEAKMKYLFNLVDRRYNAWDQQKRIADGNLNPLWLPYRGNNSLGAQLWVTTNDNGGSLMRNMGEDGPAFVRRLQEMCMVYERF